MIVELKILPYFSYHNELKYKSLNDSVAKRQALPKQLYLLLKDRVKTFQELKPRGRNNFLQNHKLISTRIRFRSNRV